MKFELGIYNAPMATDYVELDNDFKYPTSYSNNFCARSKNHQMLLRGSERFLFLPVRFLPFYAPFIGFRGD